MAGTSRSSLAGWFSSLTTRYITGNYLSTYVPGVSRGSSGQPPFAIHGVCPRCRELLRRLGWRTPSLPSAWRACGSFSMPAGLLLEETQPLMGALNRTPRIVLALDYGTTFTGGCPFPRKTRGRYTDVSGKVSRMLG